MHTLAIIFSKKNVRLICYRLIVELWYIVQDLVALVVFGQWFYD